MFAKCWKNLKLGTNKLKLDIKPLPKICLRHNNIHREIDQWKRRRLGAKWNVTVPNSVTPIKPYHMQMNIHVTGLIMSNDTQNTHILNFHQHFRKIVISRNYIKFITKNAVFCRLIQQEFNVSYETSIFRSMFMLHEYWWKQLSWRNGIRY